MKGLAIAGGIVVILMVAAIYVTRTLTPSQTGIDAGHAFTDVNNKMMSAMMGKAVVYSGNPDDDFAMLMIPHHQGAVDMAAVEIKYGTDTEIRTLAEKIAAAQQPQIDQMTKWRQGHQVTATADAETERQEFDAANNKMMNGMMGDSMAHSGNADVDFVQMMIPHHQGAVDMGQVELKFGADAEMRELAQTIVSAQEGEIAQMTNWLHAHGH